MSTQQPGQQVEGSSVSWRMVVGVVALVAAVILIAQNSQEQQVEIFWMTVRMPLWILLAITFVLGGITGWFVKARRVKRAG